MKTLHEIELAVPELFPDILHQLSKNIANSVSAFAAKDAQLAAKDAQLADQATEANLARQAAAESHVAALAAKDAQLKTQTAEADAARTTARESHAAELAKLTASHTEAIAAKDAQLATQDAEAWNTIKAFDAEHAAAITELEAQHAADLAKAASDLASAVEAEARAVHNRLDALVQAGQEAHAAGDLDALGKVLVAAYAYTSTARKAKLEADLASAQAAVTAAADKLAAL